MGHNLTKGYTFILKGKNKKQIAAHTLTNKQLRMKPIHINQPVCNRNPHILNCSTNVLFINHRV